MEEAVKFDKVGRIAIILVIIGALLFGVLGIMDVIQEKQNTYVVIREFTQKKLQTEEGTIAFVTMNLANAYGKTKTFKFTVTIINANNEIVDSKNLSYKCNAHSTDVKSIMFLTDTNFNNCRAILENIVIE